MKRILFLVHHKGNRRLLRGWLAGKYEIMQAESDQDLDQPYDLCILDGPALDRVWSWLPARKQTDRPAWLPFLLITSRQDVGMASRHLWKAVDELIISPVEKVELQARVESLLLTRRLSQECVAQERLAMLGRLTERLSQELRDPLGVITNAAYYLNLIQPDAPPNVREYLGILDTASREAVKLVTDLFSFASRQAGERLSVPAAALAKKALEGCPPPANITLQLTAHPDLPQICIDPAQIVQALKNLLVNAYQSMPAGGPVTLSIEARGAEVALAVRDSGVGISAGEMHRLFEPLFTTKGKGMGLGLVICRQLVEANGGRIEVQSEVGRGSVFTLYFPCGEDPDG